MNKERRKRLAGVLDRLSVIVDELSEIRDEEQECFDNLPASLQSTDQGMTLEANAEALNDLMVDGMDCDAAREL